MLRRGRVATLAALLIGSLAAGPVPAAPASTSAAPPAFSGPITLVSTSSAGVKANASSRAPSLSSSGMRVAFDSIATNLDPGDTDVTLDVYVKDVTTGELTLASTSSLGTKSNGTSKNQAISGDGGEVAFQSLATNLDPVDASAGGDVYVKNVDAGTLTLASTSSAGVKGNGVSGDSRLSMSRSGNRVVFRSDATNLDPGDTDTFSDVYMKKLVTGDTVLLSTSSAGVKGNQGGFSPAISKNGRRVVFESNSFNLDPADTGAMSDIYVKEIASGQLTLASTSDTGTKGNGASIDPSISGGGALVAFSSDATNLDPADTDATRDVYVKNLTTGDLTLVSTSDDGVKGDGDSVQARISGDGTRVTFWTESSNLDPADTNGRVDVYVKDLVTGDISLASSSDEGVVGSAGGELAAIGATGDVVGFDSFSSNLDPEDPDGGTDVFVKDPLLCTVVGGSGDDVLSGTSGDDVLCGRGGDDTMRGKDGEDTLFGEDGDDVLRGGTDADRLDGGDDADTLDYKSSGAGVFVDLGAGTALGGDADGDAYAGIENVQGSPLIDGLTGDDGDNVLTGLESDDVLTGAGGGDQLIGDDGVDAIDYQASPGAVDVDLGAGTASGGDAAGDSIDAIEAVVGSAFDDTLTGDAGDNFFVGMAGGDEIDGAGGIDLANYVFSPVAVTINLNNGTMKFGDARGDVLDRIENLAGSAFGDTITGSDDVNTLFGGDGDDSLFGNDGDDTLVGGAGTDTFDGEGGTDTCDDVAGESATRCEI